VAIVNWDHPQPFTVTLRVSDSDIDALGHANNTAYVRWMEQCAWQHSAALGLDIAAYHALDRAMVVLKHEINYLAAAFADEELIVGTWIISSDSKLRLTRHFQIIRPSDDVTLLRARSEYACMEISSGKPKRMPPAFIEGYGKGVLI
jgi:acyl-CoA thioester hydrolase